MTEYLAISETSSEIISIDKAIRYILGATFYPIDLFCDNKAAKDYAGKKGSHKLKTFDNDIESIIQKLTEMKTKGLSKKHILATHGDFVKECVRLQRIKIKWLSGKQNIADIMTKPLPTSAHTKLKYRIFN